MTGTPDAVASKAETSTSFGPPKQTDAGLLNVGYVDAGPADGRAVILLHGWPYDIHSYLDVTPLLATQGYRCGGRLTARARATAAFGCQRVDSGVAEHHAQSARLLAAASAWPRSCS